MQRMDSRQTLAAVGREATVLLSDATRRAAWLENARRAKRALLLVLGLGVVLVPWLSEGVSDEVFEPKRSRRLFGRDSVRRDPRAETLELWLQLGFWVCGVGWVARQAWRERPGEDPGLDLAVPAGAGRVPGDAPDPSQSRARATRAAASGAATALAPSEPGVLASELRYRIESELGRGGMGVVYAATDTVLDRKVALKSLPTELLGQGELVERFRREARLLAALTHPHIVGVHDLVLQDGQLFMAMELVQGRDLSSLLEEHGALGEPEAVRIALQAARALEHAHAQGIVHRDFKPDNVLMTPDGTAKVTDFGLAKRENGPRMTQTGAVMGTPYYMSPEQSSGEDVDARTDIYALGATLYELLCGEPPFVGGTAQVLIQHIGQPPPPLAERAPHVSPGLVGLVHEMLEKRRGDRPQSMGDVVRRLSQLDVGSAASA